MQKEHQKPGVSSVLRHHNHQGWSICPLRRRWGTRAHSGLRKGGFGGGYHGVNFFTVENGERMTGTYQLRAQYCLLKTPRKIILCLQAVWNPEAILTLSMPCGIICCLLVWTKGQMLAQMNAWSNPCHNALAFDCQSSSLLFDLSMSKCASHTDPVFLRVFSRSLDSCS